MDRAAIIETLYRYYPKNISSFDLAYYDTEEYHRLQAIRAQKDDHGDELLKELTNRFGGEYVRDRTDGEPARRFVIYIYKEDFIFEFVVHISLLVPYFNFYYRKALMDRINIRTTELEHKHNTVPVEIAVEGDIILNSVKSHFKYDLLPEAEARSAVPDISTKNLDLGQASLHDAVFSDTNIM